VLLIKLAVTAGLLWYFMKDIDWNTMGTHFGKLGLFSITSVLLLFMAQILVFSLRWFLVAGGRQSTLSLLDSVRISFIAFFFTFTIPIAMGGDISRVYYLNKSQRQLTDSVSIIFTDRFIGLVAIAVLMTLTFPFWIGLVVDEKLEQTLKIINALALAGLLLIPIVLFVSRNWRFPRFPLLNSAAARMRNSMRPEQFLMLLFLSLVIQACALAVIAVISTAMDVPISGVRELLLVVPVMIAGALPVSFGGWGIREGAMVLALSQLGISAESALAVSVMFGISQAAIGFPGIGFWLAQGKTRPGK
jgi:uncharacterized membrane protein YbhN (UPF0104 family)